MAGSDDDVVSRAKIDPGIFDQRPAAPSDEASPADVDALAHIGDIRIHKSNPDAIVDSQVATDDKGTTENKKMRWGDTDNWASRDDIGLEIDPQTGLQNMYVDVPSGVRGGYARLKVMHASYTSNGDVELDMSHSNLSDPAARQALAQRAETDARNLVDPKGASVKVRAETDITQGELDSFARALKSPNSKFVP